MLKLKINRRGDFSPLIAGIIVVLAIMAVMSALVASKKSSTRSQQTETAKDVGSKKMEELLNLQWTHPDLDTAVAANPHVSGPVTWTVEAVTGSPRLRKIVVRSARQQKVTRDIAEQTVGLVGYKYNDF